MRLRENGAAQLKRMEPASGVADSSETAASRPAEITGNNLIESYDDMMCI